jgi:hypothetical protein
MTPLQLSSREWGVEDGRKVLMGKQFCLNTLWINLKGKL